MEFNETFVSDELIEKWMPIIEGQKKWKNYVSACPKVVSKDYGLMAQLFENVETLNEAGTNTTKGIGDYNPILIPMLRRIVPALIGPQIFGTQPMSGPTGLIFALRAVYAMDSISGATTLTRANSVILTVADGTLAVVGQNVAQTLDNSVSTPTVSATGLIRHVEGNNVLVEMLSGTFTVSTGAIDVIKFNSLTIAQGEGDTTVSAVYENEALHHIIFSNYTGTVTTPNGEVLSTNMKEIDFDVQTETITAKTRKLKAKWTNELEQDLKAVHNMNAESLLKMLASDQIIMEMNREFISLIENKTGTAVAWDYTPADGRWELEKYQNLVATISRVKRQIATSSKRGQATFMIVSPAVLSVLESAGRMSTEGSDPVATAFAGTALGMKTFVDIWATTDDILLGYKGPGEIDAGIFYGPYVPIQVRKGIGEEDGQPRTFFSTRYGMVDNLFGAENYYKKITTANLPA
jgi:hypothetical protein